MSTKRNPFNENVDRLMKKIFSGKNSPSSLQKSHLSGEHLREENGILHDPSTSSLKDIHRTTEKIRQTTEQLKQMTLQMWGEAVQKKESAGEGKLYQEEKLPPREDTKRSYKDKKTAPYKAADGSRKKATPYQATNDSRKTIASYGSTDLPWRKMATPQYRVEENLDNTVPERIRECKALARSPQGYRMTKEELFFRQAQIMEDYVDDQLYPGEFSWYFPTYQAMNIAQLRGYFTWRAQVRQGNIMPEPLSFAFVYIYELLHQIGAKTPEEGFLLLKTFWENYREYGTALDRYMENWLCDYVVYYNLDRELLSNLQDTEFDDAMLVFLHPEEKGEEAYFSAICALSKYNMKGSKFYKEYSEDVQKVTCGVFRALTVYYEKHGKKTLPEKYFGKLTSCAYQIFASAVFYDDKHYAEYEYVFNPLHRYHCLNGHWSCEKYFGNRTKNKELGQILKAIDARMREKYEYSALLKPENVTKLVMNIIEKEITKVLEEKKKNVVPAIEIDVAKLSGIRRAAELTKARLIVEGSEEDAEVEEAKFEDVEFKNVDMEQMEFVWENSVEREEKRAEPIFASGEDTENGKETALFDQAECILLRGLLYGEPYQDFLREHRIMLSIVVDAVNEKLFDYFADTTIVFDGDVPQILADYQEEVAAILKKEQKF
jgi:hypothetical protein